MSRSNGPNRNNNQQTIARAFTLTGVGIHSGEECTAVFKPAGDGISFIYGGEKFPADAERVTDTTRGTSIGKVQVVEHILAAAAGLGIDNFTVELSRPEPPIMDGSALPFVEGFKKAGIREMGKGKRVYVADRELEIIAGESSLRLVPYDGFEVHFMLKFPYIGRQDLVYTGEDFEAAIAPARTFGLMEELEMLKGKGLARGASLDNSLAIGKEGYVNTPRFPDEPVRHKILDLIGDLSLTGRKVRGKIFAVRSGHKLNVELARRILKLC